MSEERFQRGPNYSWKGEGGSNEYRPFLSKKEPSHRVLQNGSSRGRFMGRHHRSLKENPGIILGKLGLSPPAAGSLYENEVQDKNVLPI